MEQQSLQATIESALVGAKNAHHLAVEQGVEQDDNWPAFYAAFIVRRLVPLMTAFQSEHYPHSNTCVVEHGFVNPKDSCPVKGFSGESLRHDLGGPGWIAEASQTERVKNCHDTGDC